MPADDAARPDQEGFRYTGYAPVDRGQPVAVSGNAGIGITRALHKAQRVFGLVLIRNAQIGRRSFSAFNTGISATHGMHHDAK